MCSATLAFHVTATLLDRKEILERNNLECLHLILYIASLEFMMKLSTVLLDNTTLTLKRK